MDSGSEIDSFILSIAIFTIAGVITHFWDTRTALHTYTTFSLEKLMPTPRHTELSNVFWLYTPQRQLAHGC